MRSFVAINLPEKLRVSLSTTASGFAKIRPLRPVKPDNIHLTLKFLGEVNEASIESIKQALSSASRGHDGFSLNVRSIGAFPDLRRPSVIWAGLDESRELLNLWSDIEKHLADIGFAPEPGGFSPHLTIGRVKDAKLSAGIADIILPLKDSFFGSIDVAVFSLMKSILKPEGPVYSVLADFYLKKD
jgi:2'-5' RNA ligase